MPECGAGGRNGDCVVFSSLKNHTCNNQCSDENVTEGDKIHDQEVIRLLLFLQSCQ